MYSDGQSDPPLWILLDHGRVFCFPGLRVMAGTYAKPFLTFDDQLTLLQQRGLAVADRDAALHMLRAVGYYTLGGYLYPMREFAGEASEQPRLDQFVSGASFEQMVDLYRFDRHLRLLCLEALETIERCVKVAVAYTLGQLDPFAHHSGRWHDQRNLQAREGHYDPAAGMEMLRDDVNAVVFGKGRAGLESFAHLEHRLRGHHLLGMQLESLADDYLEVVRPFAENFVLAVPFAPAPEGRTIIKFKYTEQLQADRDERSGIERATDRLGWSKNTIRFPLPGAMAAGSIHFEATVPDGTAIIEGAIETPGESSNVTSYTLTRSGRPTIHMTDSDDAREEKCASINLRVSRDGWLRTALLSSLAITGVMVASGLRLDAVLGGDENRAASVDAAAVLLTGVAVAGAFVVKPGEHALTSRALTWLRVVALVGVGALFGGAWLLAFMPEWEGIFEAWFVLTLVTMATTVALGVAYVGPQPLPDAENGVQ